MKQLALTIALVAVGVVGCDAPPSSSAIPQPPAETGVVNVATDDPEMDAAIEKAKQTMSFFEENWEKNRQYKCSVKFALPTNSGDREHIWFTPTSINGDSFTGTCGNNPLDVPNLKYGDQRTVNREDVTDWMIMLGKKCYGGYTVRVLAKRDPDAAPPIEFVDHEK